MAESVSLSASTPSIAAMMSPAARPASVGRRFLEHLADPEHAVVGAFGP